MHTRWWTIEEEEKSFCLDPFLTVILSSVQLQLFPLSRRYFHRDEKKSWRWKTEKKRTKLFPLQGRSRHLLLARRDWERNCFTLFTVIIRIHTLDSRSILREGREIKGYQIYRARWHRKLRNPSVGKRNQSFACRARLMARRDVEKMHFENTYGFLKFISNTCLFISTIMHYLDVKTRYAPCTKECKLQGQSYQARLQFASLSGCDYAFGNKTCSNRA